MGTNPLNLDSEPTISQGRSMREQQGRKDRDLYRNPKKERRDMNASLLGGVFALFSIFLALQDPLLNQKFNTDLALLMPENAVDGDGIPFEVLSGAQMGLFIAGEAIRALIVAIIALLIILVVRSYTQKEFFTFRTARRVAVISWLIMIYPLGIFFQGMGENSVAADFGLDVWFDRSGTFFESSFLLWYVTLMAISMVGVMLYRAARMQKDQEGLI